MYDALRASFFLSHHAVMNKLQRDSFNHGERSRRRHCIAMKSRWRIWEELKPGMRARSAVMQKRADETFNLVSAVRR